jgi:hypothetical protein
MHDTTAMQVDVVGDTKALLEAPSCGRGAERASGLYVVGALDDEQLPPSARRGASSSWLPGTWGDPF